MIDLNNYDKGIGIVMYLANMFDWVALVVVTGYM